MLEAVRWRQAGSAETQRPIRRLFLFTGADPNTDWLEGSGIALDEGFVLTGNGRPLETSMQGVFAIGDVRSGSVKRVAASVGEGAQVVAALHNFRPLGPRRRRDALKRKALRCACPDQGGNCSNREIVTKVDVLF